MSARLIKNGADTAVINFVPFIPPQEGTNTPRQRGTVVPFVPKSTSELKTLSATAAQPARYEEAVSDLDVESLIAEAQAEAARIIAEAQATAAQIKEEAQALGMAEARACIDEELAQMVAPVREQLAQTIEEVSSLRESVIERAERDIVKLSIEIAKKIVHREVTIDSEVALTLARVALTRIHSRAQAKVHLHPEDYAYISKHLERLTTGNSIDLLEDRAIGRGGCLIETEMGDIDARIEQQFEELERSFLGV